MKTIFTLMNFGRTWTPEPIAAGTPLKNEIIDDVLLEICLLSDLNMDQLEESLD